MHTRTFRQLRCARLCAIANLNSFVALILHASVSTCVRVYYVLCTYTQKTMYVMLDSKYFNVAYVHVIQQYPWHIAHTGTQEHTS